MHHSNKDDEIEEVRSRLSLLCPLTCMRIEIPAKGSGCKHAQCFDLMVRRATLACEE